jgi:hypothetical protein
LITDIDSRPLGWGFGVPPFREGFLPGGTFGFSEGSVSGETSAVDAASVRGVMASALEERV